MNSIKKIVSYAGPTTLLASVIGLGYLYYKNPDFLKESLFVKEKVELYLPDKSQINKENKIKNELNQKVLSKQDYDKFFNDENIKINQGSCYLIGSIFELKSHENYEELIRNNSEFKNGFFYIKLPLKLKDSNLKQNIYKVSFEEAGAYHLNTKGIINSPAVSTNKKLPSYGSIGINALSIVYGQHTIGKKSFDTSRLEYGNTEKTIKTLLGEQAITKKYYKNSKKRNISIEQLTKDLYIFNKYPKKFYMGFGVNGTLNNYKTIKTSKETNHMIYLKKINLDKKEVEIIDPNNNSKNIKISFSHLYNIIGTYHIGTIKAISKNTENENIFIPDNRKEGSPRFYKYLAKKNTLNAIVTSTDDPNIELREKRGDIDIIVKSIKKKNDKKITVLELRSYDQKTHFVITENKNNNYINLNLIIDGINLDINIEKNEVKLGTYEKLKEFFSLKIDNILGNTHKTNIIKTDKYLNAEKIVNLINYIYFDYIQRPKGISKNAFSLNNNELNINIKQKNIIKEWLEINHTIIKNIDIFKIKDIENKNKFIDFLNKLHINKSDTIFEK